MEFGVRFYSETSYRPLSNLDKLALARCCHCRQIPFRFMIDAYIPPRTVAEPATPGPELQPKTEAPPSA
eukprot:7975841-Karenia_brevis.AAC.1